MPHAPTPVTTVLCAFAFAFPFVALFAPLGAVPLLLVAAVLTAGAWWRSGHRWPAPDRTVASALVMLLVWSAVTAFWAPDPLGSLSLVVRIGLLFAAGLMLIALAGALDARQRALVGRWLTAGVGIGLVVLAEEIVLGAPLLGMARSALADGRASAVDYNRGATALAMASWPAAAFLWQRGWRWRALLLPLAAGAAVALSESLAAGTGMVAGALVATAALVHRRAGHWVLVAMTALFLVASPFVAQTLYARNWQNVEWLPFSAQQRVALWHTTAGLIAEKPLHGWGFDATRTIARQSFSDPAQANGLLPLHPHSAALQVLLELGAVGGAIAFAILIVISGRLDRLPAPARPLGQASLAATLVIAGTAYGVWQNHWLATMLSAALFVSLSGPARQPPSPD